MSLYKGHHVRYADLPRALSCLPEPQLGAGFNETLALWQKWYAQGALQAGWVEGAGSAVTPEIQCLGVSLWITDEAVLALQMTGEGSAAQRIVKAVLSGTQTSGWVMQAAELREAHAAQKLNLLVLHFWARLPPFDPKFQPVFVHSNVQFRAQHQGYGVQWLLQEVPLPQAHVLTAGGLKILRADPADSPMPMALLGLNRDDAHGMPGSALAFLFFSPKNSMDLRPSVQRMLGLALEQLTDDDIAQALSCSRDYVRKLWDDAYDKLNQAGVIHAGNGLTNDSPGAPRGRERRRQALEFFRNNPQELRPGLPDEALAGRTS